MSKIKVGDRIRYTGKTYVYDQMIEDNEEGIVLATRDNPTYPYRVFFPGIAEEHMPFQVTMFGLLCRDDELEVVKRNV